MSSIYGVLSHYSSNKRSIALRMTEVVDNDDPRANSNEIRNAINDEVQDLLRRGTFNVILKEELPDGTNALSTVFVLDVKCKADGQLKYKARYVIG